MLRVVRNLYGVLMNVQRRQFVCAGVGSRSSGLRTIAPHDATHDQNSLRGVPLQAPCLRVSAVMDEKFSEHFSARANAKEFSVIAKFGPIVR